MQPLSAVVADVLTQLNLTDVKPEDCRLTLVSRHGAAREAAASCSSSCLVGSACGPRRAHTMHLFPFMLSLLPHARRRARRWTWACRCALPTLAATTSWS